MSQFLALSHLQAVKSPTKKYTYVLLNTESYAINSWDFVPSLTWSGLFSDFLKGTVISTSFLWILWHFTSPNRQSPPIASEEVEKAFCWRSCLPCHCKLCANHTAHGGEVGHLPPWLSVGTSLLVCWTPFLLLHYHCYRGLHHPQLPLLPFL